MPKSSSNRVAIVAGLRTPFLKIATGYSKVLSRTLSSHLVNELVTANNLDKKELELLVFGQVILAPNLAREVVMGANLPTEVDAYTVSRACASSYQSTVDVYHNIISGNIDVGIAGGCDLMSRSVMFG